ncbi:MULTISPECIES: hypothetical protein [unclassified Streptomyces]|uniref:hypothetical protein n=1 Tax=unclassified Streptomyces TaxID=2593676 RepID=UPI002966BB00|nr:hypothetical protein [Streptomyces sp. SJL17-1]
MIPAILGTAVVLAILAIRTALKEMREPGSAQHEWTFLHDRHSLTVALASATGLGALAWTLTGPAAVPWAVLAGLLVGRVFSWRK